ncbi:Tripeptidyl-peptidase sed2 [Didymella sp. IMI 355093]|nr:Tripeptidyl-peptidase sed2 [Didymella sp. IMI 355093]
MKCSLIAGLLAVAGANGKPTSHIESESVNVETLRTVPQGWSAIGAPAGHRKLPFRIAVRSADNDVLERTLMEVSDPHHARYGQHLKRDELKDLIKPRAESSKAVLSWLEESGISSEDIKDDGEWITFHAPVKRAESMLGTTFKTYQNQVRRDVKRVRSLSYSVPKAIRDHIDLIEPTVRFGQIKAERSNVLTQEAAPFSVAAVNATCNTTITPACLKDLYNFADYKIDPKGAVKLGVSGFLEQLARYTDLEQFVSTFAPDAGSNFTSTSVNGGTLDQNATDDSVEANLDIDYTVGLVDPTIETTFYSTAGRGILVPDLDQPSEDDNENEPYLDFFTYVVGLPDDELPQVLSTSYGEDEQSVPATYAKKVCDIIGQLGTRGVSVIFSSGDTGVGSACQTNDGKNTTRFLPIFPASCPYVTSVGGTYKIEPERAVSFSSAAVDAYLEKLGSQWEGLYNPAGRGFPDVAAQGQGFRVVDKGLQISVGGTSASAPVFASVVALLNNARLAAGQPSLGFLNPWIYSKGYQGLTDIKDGGSTGCIGRSIYSGLKAPLVPYASWNATEGWDPVTGYGTPNFEKLLELSQGQSNSSYSVPPS